MKQATTTNNGHTALREQLQDNTEAMHKMASRLGDLNLISRKFEAMEAEYQKQLASNKELEKSFLSLANKFKDALTVINDKQSSTTQEINKQVAGMSKTIISLEKALKDTQQEMKAREQSMQQELEKARTESRGYPYAVNKVNWRPLNIGIFGLVLVAIVSLWGYREYQHSKEMAAFNAKFDYLIRAQMAATKNSEAGSSDSKVEKKPSAKSKYSNQ